jgi:hypothetical protein
MASPSKHDDCPFKDIVFPEKAAASESDHRMDTRVGRLEGVVESLTHDIQQVSQNINMMGKELGNFKEVVGDALTKMRDAFGNQINTVTDRLTTSAKPQWQTISAFAALAITLLGMAGAVVALIMSGQSQNITDLKRDTAVITERMFANQYEKGKSDAFAAETSSHLAKLDTTLQREMTLMQQTTDSKIISLDDKLQTELKLDRKNNADYIDRIEKIIQDFRAWRLAHSAEGSAIDAKLEAKQEMVLEMLKTIDARMTRLHDEHEKAK